MKWLLTILGLLYVLNPFDMLPDIVVGVGWLDDLAVLGLLGYYLYRTGYRGFPFGDGSTPDQNQGAAKPDDQANEESDDPHKILGVRAGAGQEEIRQAYRHLAAQYHPDKVAHLGAELRQLAEKKFKSIQAAYEKVKRP